MLFLAAEGGAQGLTTAGIRGSVSAGDARSVDAFVRVTSNATGFSVEVRASRGRFLVQGLEPGGPYTITVRSFGFVPQRRDGIVLKLGELTDMVFALEPLAMVMDTVRVTARQQHTYAAAHADGGTGMTISASVLERLPTLNRDLYDFVRLVPQISTKISLSNPGLSAAGTGFRYNNFLLNGVSERSLSGGVSPAFAGVKSVPLDAVQEFQVLLSPYDVRYGDFAGALVNSITKSGTNTMLGSVFMYGRNDRLARSGSTTPYEKEQYGFSLGGPIVRNRLHFFMAAELQRFTSPPQGPYVGQPEHAKDPVPVSADDLDRFETIMRNHGLTAGSAGPVLNRNPQRNLFTRLDLAIPSRNSRLSLWDNYSGSEELAFSRPPRDTFALSSYAVTTAANARTTALQLHSVLRRAGGGHNDLLVSLRSQALPASSAVQQPVIRASVPAASGSGFVTLVSGTNEMAQGTGFRSNAFSIKDNVSLAFGTGHIATFGAEVERFHLRRGVAARPYGNWSFASLDDLQRGIADRYEVRIGFGDRDPAIGGTQYAVYAGDQWRTDRLSVTGGIRADMLDIDERPPYNALVDSLLGRRTDLMPGRRIELSPRAGFIWNMSGTRQQYLRGGIGVFTGRYPLAWAHAALSTHGVGGVLQCARRNPVLQRPPAFSPDHLAPPTMCLGGATITQGDPGEVALTNPNMRMMRVVRGSFAFDWRLPGDVLVTNEALVTRGLSDFVFLNLNLAEPQGADVNGRVLYGTIGPGGVAEPRTRSAFSEVIEVSNTSRNHSYQLSTKLEKSRLTGASGSVSYTYSRVRDAQTPLRVNNRGTITWASARVTSGRHDDLAPGISSNDLPHRIVAVGSFATSRLRTRTRLSFYYVGESGRPFTYIASGASRRGDLNADGSNSNDPIYVPRSALDPSEISISGLSTAPGSDTSAAAQAASEITQRNALENFIGRTACLRRQRGRILERNSCREAWSNTTAASIRQTLPIASRTIEAQIDVFNLLNLLNGSWGWRTTVTPALLQHVGQTTQSGAPSRSVFRFETPGPPAPIPAESNFQLQVSVRYRY
jgi:hypothetical protein